MSSNEESTVTIISSPESADVPTEFDTVKITNDVKYRFSGRVVNHDTFSLKIINEDYTKRWAGDFSANFIDDVTTKAGCIKRISVFWKMLTEIAQEESQTASLEILTPVQVQEIRDAKNKNPTTIMRRQQNQKKSFKFAENFGIEDENDKLYVIVTQKSEYDCFKYPLILPTVPFTYEEYAETIKMLYHDNAQLHKSLIAADCSQVVRSLENKVTEFAKMFEEMKKTKDDKIKALRKKIKTLQSKQKEQQQPTFPIKSKK